MNGSRAVAAALTPALGLPPAAGPSNEFLKEVSASAALQKATKEMQQIAAAYGLSLAAPVAGSYKESREDLLKNVKKFFLISYNNPLEF